MKRFAGLLVGALLGFVGLVPQASAGLFFYPGQVNEILYNNYENLYNAGGTLLSPSTIPVVGDHLAGIFQVNRIIDLTGGAGSNIPTTTEFTGVFAQDITSVSPIAGGFALTLGNPTVTTFNNGAGDTFTLSDLGGNKMFALYADSGLSTFTFQGLPSLNVSNATDGTLLLASGIDNAHDVNNTAFSTVFFPIGFPINGVATASLSIETNNTGLTFSPHTPITFIGPSGELVIQSRFTFNFDTLSQWGFTSFDPSEIQPNVVPEISSLWMLGMGLSGFGIFRRRKLFS